MKSSETARPAVSSRLVPAGVGLLPLVCILGIVVMLGVAGLSWNTSPYYGKPTASTPRTAKKQVNVGTIPVHAKPVAAALALSPNRIDIPRLKAVAPIVKVGTTPDRELQIPENPKIVGWWSPGAKPGAGKGTAILAGHINYAGVDGTLSRIGQLKPGDEVDLYGTQNAGHKSKVEFTVTGVRTYHKTKLPYQQIFDQSSVGRIAIVTCGGPFDPSTGNYLDNIVVFAVPS
ncbi:class F sortase [uncultured Jatrophihabitans sp.]|uniref:class F sortase n=1 Tax=uncultured Jatrophihabitans sp. TaxID=1610747 RepID=UPI0035CAB56C